MSHELPFEGLRVVDLSQGLAGPSAAMLLAQYGADVIKIEPFEGDWSRHRGAGGDGITSLCAATNLGKRSIALDLKHPQGAEVLHRLARRADVFLESFRAGVTTRLGFGYERIAAQNPTLVYLSISGFGQTGPLRERPATDAVMQAFSGIMGVNKGPVDGMPHRILCWPIDMATGVYAFQAIAVALYARRDSGRGRYIDASLLQGAAGLQSVRIIDHVAAGGGDAPATACPIGTFRATDGWVNFVVASDEKWPALCAVLGRPELAADASLARLAGRRARAAELTAIITAVFATHDCAHWCDALTAVDILNERVYGYDEMLAHAQTHASGAFTWLDQPGVGRVPFPNVPGPPPIAPGCARAGIPAVGADTHAVLGEIGYTTEQIAALVESAAAR